MKKAQVQQVFIYMMVLIVVGGILLIAVKIIPGLINNACDVEHATFESQLGDLIEKSSDYGDVISDEIYSPCGFERLCIMDSEKIKETDMATNSYIQAIHRTNRLIQNEIEVQTGNNIFLIKGNEIIPLLALENIVVSENGGVICYNSTSGQFYMRLEGKGRGKVSLFQQPLTN